MQAVVTLKEALELMRTGDPFDLVWITADRQRRRGGEVLTAKGARLPTKRTTENGLQKTENANPSSVVPSPSRAADRSISRNRAANPPWTRRPNHYANGTRNIRLATGKVRKVHIQLIDSINGMKVV